MKPKKSLPAKKQGGSPESYNPKMSVWDVPVTEKQIAAVKRNTHLLDGKGSLLTLLPEPKTKKKQ